MTLDALKGRHLVLGVTGGIAAYKSCELVRRLRDAGCSVQVVMTEGALRFVGAASFQALSGRPVLSDLWDPRVANGMPHIDLSRESDGILVAPASASFMARLVQGQASDLLTTLCIAREVPLWLAPAMNRQMWENPAVQDTVSRLSGQGVALWGPASGDQACGEVGPGRMLEPDALIEQLAAALHGLTVRGALPLRGLLAERRVVITAGPTFEPIDPVRGITNRSSGTMGYALAQACAEAGAQVTLVSGPVRLDCPAGVRRVSVTTAREMASAVEAALEGVRAHDLFIGVAAVADWRPELASEHKLKKDQGADLSGLRWVENPDILAGVGHRPAERRPYTVGFAAETETGDQLFALLEPKRQRKRADLLIGNAVQESLGQSDAALTLCSSAGLESLPRQPKSAAGAQIVHWLARQLAPVTLIT
ncbi:MAG: phosphopantothenoylcysteine decarboxylase / Phosphopantothenate--cysteine ligase [Pseudomonadota bacterium]